MWRRTSKIERKRIVVVGAGFAGLAAVRRLSRSLEVTVVDKSPHFDFLPNIHELVSGVKSPAALRLPLEPIIRKTGHRYIRDRVIDLDPTNGVLSLSTGDKLFGDVLIVAVGGVNNTFGVPGAEDHALAFKNVDDCHRIGRSLDTVLARNAQSMGSTGRKPGSLVVVGGGLEGIETLGEILRRRGDARLGVHIVEAGTRLMPSAPPTVHEVLESHCRAHGVGLHLDVRVSRVEAKEVLLTDGTVLPSDLTIWTGGARAPSLLAESGLADSDGGWARVRPTLQSEAQDTVFVIGDAAAVTPEVSKQAYHALDMGAQAAENVERLLIGEPLVPFRPASKPMVVSFGHLDTFVVHGDRVFAGVALAPLKEAVYQVVMAQLDPLVTPRGLFGAFRRFVRGKAPDLLAIRGVRLL